MQTLDWSSVFVVCKHISAGRCVSPVCIFGKSGKHTFSCRNIFCLRKKMFTIFSCCFYVIVTSQSGVPIFRLLKGLKTECFALTAEINPYDLISCINITDEILLEHMNSDLEFFKEVT